MGLTERIIANRHKEHAAIGRSDVSCPLCRVPLPERVPEWRRRDLAKDMTPR